MNQNRRAGLLVVAAGVGAAFVVMIGTGYRVARTAGSPIGDGLYVASIVVLVASIVLPTADPIDAGRVHRELPPGARPYLEQGAERR